MAEKLTVTPEQLTSFSLLKNEPDWFLDIRLKALELRKNEDECIFVVGSFYLLGEVKRVIKSYF